jgi:hypothetical protein
VEAKAIFKHEELKKRLLEQYEKSLDELLNNLPTPEEVTLNDLEKATGKRGAAVTQATLHGVSLAKELQTEGEIHCARCGGRSQKRGKPGKRVINFARRNPT